MPTEQSSIQLFSLGHSIEGVPAQIDPSSFKELKAEEFRDIERWIKKQPQLLGEELCILAAQLSDWTKGKDRSDLIALDKRGKLVVIEIKRDEGRWQDIQAIRYAAYASTMSAEDVVAVFQEYQEEEGNERPTDDEARLLLEAFVDEENFSLDDLDEDEAPRMALVARRFHQGVTSTTSWSS